MKALVIATSNAEYLAKNLKKKVKGLEAVFRFFADGEIYVRIPALARLKKRRVLVLHSGVPKPNSGLIELEIILQILKDNKVRPEIFFTYFPYGRQDKVFKKGETNFAEGLIKKLVNHYKARKIYIIDPHFDKRPWVKKYPVRVISALALLVAKVERDFGRNLLFLSPDKGGQRRTGISMLTKSPKISLKGKKIVMVDDIIAKGGTLLECYNELKKLGAKNTLALVTHGVLPEGARRVKNRFDKLYLTNTIRRKEANVDVTNLIKKILS